MSNYLFLVNPGDDIISSVHITKFVPNRRVKSDEALDFKVGVFVQKKYSLKWEKLDEVNFEGLENIRLKSSDYNLEVGEIAVVVPCDINCQLKDHLSKLPKPIIRKVDDSPVSERAAISFERGKSTSSYQGDFPYQMTKIKGTFLCFDSLASHSQTGVINKLILINIFSQELSEKKEFSLNMANSITKENIKKQLYVQNSAAIMTFDCEKELSSIFYSKDTLGIPIFISYHKDLNSNLSVEHSHPPSEFFFGDTKLTGQQTLKKKWLSSLV